MLPCISGQCCVRGIFLISLFCLILTLSLHGHVRAQGEQETDHPKTVESKAPIDQAQDPLQREDHHAHQESPHSPPEQYLPEKPQHQEHQQKLHEEEKQRQAQREQQILEEQQRQEQQNILLKQEQEAAERQKQQFKPPLLDTPENDEQIYIEAPKQSIQNNDPDQAHQENVESINAEEVDESDEPKDSVQSVNPLKSNNEGVEISDDADIESKDTLPSPPLRVEVPSSPEDSEKGNLNEIPPKTKDIIPPILKESEPELEDSQETEEDSTSEEQLSSEQIEGERLFQAGEKLINATYYKEYKEAYLHFLEASGLNHKKAKEYVAFGHLFGDYLPQNITRAAELFEELAESGSPKAQMGLAFMYSAGFYYNSSQAKALIFSTFGALGGDSLAQMALGYRYYAGIGVESKCETALTYYKKVASTVAETVTVSGGPVVQRIRLQDEVENQGTSNSPLLDDDLLQYYHFLADKGDQQAQVVLGTLYYQGGKGVQINHDQAYHYFSTAAEGGSGHAMGFLGKMHSEGSPVVKQSNETALALFRQSAEKNNHIGQAGLGMMYLNGFGVDKDTKEAFKYFSLSSDQGSVDGQLQLGIMYFNGIGVRKDYKMAVKYFTMASQNGHVLAFYNLAQMHATGTGVLRNCHTAVELFKNVAERGRWSEQLMDAHRMYHDGNVDTSILKYMFLSELGYEVAQSNVAYLLDIGSTSKFNSYESHQRALLQFSRAASQGSTQARLKMGDYHYYGYGTEVDYESAASHYRMASEQQHNPQAMFNLGYMHEQGLGLKQDVHLAKRFYDMAAETNTEAHVPVALALAKLGVFYGMDVFSKEFEGFNTLFKIMDPVQLLGPEWDLYLASVLSFIIGIIFILRRR